MKLMPSKPVLYALVAVAGLFGLWGYCFEVAYFGRLKLNVHEHLGLRHFVASSAISIIPMLLALLVFRNVTRFFTKKIHVDPGKEVAEHLKSKNFEQFITFARAGASVALIFLVLVIALPAVGVGIKIWPMYLYMVFLVLEAFFGAMTTSPPHARLPIVLAFALSVAACFGGGGYGYAASPDSASSGVLRDDFIAKVTKSPGGVLKVEPKSLKISLPPSLKIIETFGW